MAAGAAAVAILVGGAAAAQDRYDNHNNYNNYNEDHASHMTSMGYVDGLQWKINHAERKGVIDHHERDRLLAMQQRTHYLAWRCDHDNNGQACRRADDNVRYIESEIHAYGGYGHDWRNNDWRNNGWNNKGWDH